jgi:hypothetical protein
MPVSYGVEMIVIIHNYKKTDTTIFIWLRIFVQNQGAGSDQIKLVNANFWEQNFGNEFLWNSAVTVNLADNLLISRYHYDLNVFYDYSDG